MDSFCSSSLTLNNELGVSPGAGIPWGLGLMAIGAGQGVLSKDGLNATHVMDCMNEMKAVACDVNDAYHSVMTDKKLGPAIGKLISAQSAFSTAMTDCKADMNEDLPMIKEWASLFQQPAS